MRYLPAEYWHDENPGLAARLALSDTATVLVRLGRASQVARIDWLNCLASPCEAADSARMSYQWPQIPGLRYQGVCLPALVLLPGIKLGVAQPPKG